MYSVLITDHAEADLNCLAQDLIDRASRQVALRYIKEIRKTCDSLALMPLRFEECPELAGRRKVSVPPFIIFYRVEENTVFILRILHGRQDITEGLF